MTDAPRPDQPQSGDESGDSAWNGRPAPETPAETPGWVYDATAEPPSAPEPPAEPAPTYSPPAHEPAPAYVPPPAYEPPAAQQPPVSHESSSHESTASEPSSHESVSHSHEAAHEPASTDPPANQPPPNQPPPAYQPPSHETPPAYEPPPAYLPPAYGDPTSSIPVPPEPPVGYPPAGGYQPPGDTSYSAGGAHETPGYQQGSMPSTPPGGPIPPIPGPRGGGLNGFIAGLGGQANMFGILSAGLGLLSVVCCICTSFGGGGAYFFTLILAIPAVGLGIMHMLKVKRGQATNRNLALLGIALGVLGLFIAICGGTSSVGPDIHNDIR